MWQPIIFSKRCTYFYYFSTSYPVSPIRFGCPFFNVARLVGRTGDALFGVSRLERMDREPTGTKRRRDELLPGCRLPPTAADVGDWGGRLKKLAPAPGPGPELGTSR